MRISLILLLHLTDFNRKARRACRDWLQLGKTKQLGDELVCFWSDGVFVVGYE